MGLEMARGDEGGGEERRRAELTLIPFAIRPAPPAHTHAHAHARIFVVLPHTASLSSSLSPSTFLPPSPRLVLIRSLARPPALLLILPSSPLLSSPLVPLRSSPPPAINLTLRPRFSLPSLTRSPRPLPPHSTTTPARSRTTPRPRTPLQPRARRAGILWRAPSRRRLYQPRRPGLAEILIRQRRPLWWWNLGQRLWG